MNEYASEITLGEKYKDSITGVEGTATSLSFDLDGTQQVCLEWGSNGERKREWFDVDRVLA